MGVCKGAGQSKIKVTAREHNTPKRHLRDKSKSGGCEIKTNTYAHTHTYTNTDSIN